MSESDSTPTIVFCPNCGQQKQSRFCAICGQNDRDYNRSTLSIIRSFISETLEMDSRFLQTAKDMFCSPGKLTLEFRRNRRATYSSPVKLYLLTSILYFFVFSMVVDFAPPFGRGEFKGPPPRVDVIPVDEQDVDLDATIAEIRKHLEPDIFRKLIEIRKRPDGAISKIVLNQFLKNISGDYVQRRFTPFLLGALVNFLHTPDIVLELYMDNMPLCMLVLMPWYAILLKLLYLSSKTPFAHHIIFTIHIFSLSFVVLTGGMLLDQLLEKTGILGGSMLISCIVAYLIIYVVIALRVNFQQGWLLTISKFIGLSFFFWLMVVPSFLLVLLITIMQL